MAQIIVIATRASCLPMWPRSAAWIRENYGNLRKSSLLPCPALTLTSYPWQLRLERPLQTREPNGCISVLRRVSLDGAVVAGGPSALSTLTSRISVRRLPAVGEPETGRERVASGQPRSQFQGLTNTRPKLDGPAGTVASNEFRICIASHIHFYSC